MVEFWGARDGTLSQHNGGVEDGSGTGLCGRKCDAPTPPPLPTLSLYAFIFYSLYQSLPTSHYAILSML